MAFLLAKPTPLNVNHGNDRFSSSTKSGTSPWIGKLPEREWNLGEPSKELPANLKEASAVAIAQQRRATFIDQIGHVIRWLQVAHGLGMTPRNAPQAGRMDDCDLFNPAAFKAFAKSIPTGGTERRKAAVAKLLRAKKVPGRGGIAWELFRRLVNKEAGGSYNLKTIQRDVAAAQGLRRAK
jgi:hypothetical protein